MLHPNLWPVPKVYIQTQTCGDLSFHAGVVWIWGAELLETMAESFIVNSYEVSECVFSALSCWSPLFLLYWLNWCPTSLHCQVLAETAVCWFWWRVSCLVSKALSVFGSVLDGIFVWVDFLLAAFMPTFKLFFDLLSFYSRFMYLNLNVTYFVGLVFQYQYVYIYFCFQLSLKCGFQTLVTEGCEGSSQMYRKTINLLSKTTLK